jgi:hypothetical protein
MQRKPLDGWCSQLNTPAIHRPIDPLWSNHPAGSIDPEAYKYRGSVASWSQHASTYHPIEYRSIDRSQCLALLQRRTELV